MRGLIPRNRFPEMRAELIGSWTGCSAELEWMKCGVGRDEVPPLETGTKGTVSRLRGTAKTALQD